MPRFTGFRPFGEINIRIAVAVPLDTASPAGRLDTRLRLRRRPHEAPRDRL